jgi:hypothetical protein
MVPRLKNIDVCLGHAVHELVPAGDPSAPNVAVDVLERLGLTQSDEQRALGGVGQPEHAKSEGPIRLNRVL